MQVSECQGAHARANIVIFQDCRSGRHMQCNMHQNLLIFVQVLETVETAIFYKVFRILLLYFWSLLRIMFWSGLLS
jgi:hypothetical protein